MRSILSALLALAMVLSLSVSEPVYAADGSEGSGKSFFSRAIEAAADFFGIGDDATDAGAQARAATTGDGVQRTADTGTTQKYTLGDEDSTQYDGRVWVDKSVSAEDKVTFGSNVVTNESDFLVTYSALATSTSVQGGTPVDVVFVLDLSASMCWGTQAQTVTTKEDSRIKAMVDALNENISILAQANSENRIGVAVFNGTGRVLMRLTRVENFHSIQNDQYFTLSDFSGTNGQDDGRATVTCNMNGETADTAGGTNVQAGLYQGMKLLANETNTTFTVDEQTVTRIPNVVVMSDGAPTTFASPTNAQYREGDSGRWHDTGGITNDSDLGAGTDTQVSGSWWEPVDNSGQTGQIGGGDNYRAHSADGFMALATASYMKNKISANYYGKDGAVWGTNADNTANVYTIGFSTDRQTDAMATMANIVLNPEDNLNNSLVNSNLGKGEIARMWTAAQDYLDSNAAEVYGHIGNKGNNDQVPDRSDNGQYKWADMQLREFIAQHPNDEYDFESFNYPTQYFSANDTQGLIDAFEEIASMITSSASVPTEVTGNPIDSGYITYKDTTGQYMEIKNVKRLIFMDQVLNVTKDEKNSSEDREVYVAGSYEYSNPAYPGQSFNTNQIKIVVTDNGDNTQTIEVNVPAALIPLRTNTVTLDGNGVPTNNETSKTMPLRLCYEVGLAEGIDAVTLNGVDEEYLKNNSENGKVSFYSNAYTEGGQTNNGVGATVEFEPAPTNPFYFVQEDTPLYVADEGSPTGYSRAIGQFDSGATYYVPMTYYDGAGSAVEKVTSYVARSGETLERFVHSDDSGLYIREGSPRIGNLQDVTASKPANETGTYGKYREPTFVFDQGGTDPQKGHFLVLLGNNGKLSIPFVSKDVSLASDNTHASIDGQLVGVGEKLHYTIDWVNTAVDQNGTAINSEITVVDTLPAGTTYVENSAQPADALYNEDENTITWTIQADAGQSGTVEFDVVVDPAAVENKDNALPNTATIEVGNNEYITNTTVNYVPEKSVSMPDGSGGTADADGKTVMPGTQLTYTIEYRNTESTGSTVTITDAVPGGTTFVSADPQAQPDGNGNLTWTISNVAAGATGSVSFTVEVDNSAVTTIENEANVKIGDHNPVVTNKVTTNVDRASLIVKKEVTADPGLTAPDKEFDFELTIPSKAGAQDVAATIHTDREDDQTTSLNFDADGKTTFTLEADQSIEISGMGGEQYSVVEQNAANGAVNSGFTLSKVEGATGASSAGNDQPINDEETATAAGTVGSDNATVTFTNRYSASGETTLTGTKTITGRDFRTGDEFTFSITGKYTGSVQGATAPMPANVENGKITIKPESEKSADINFGKISFTQPGTYVYTISEEDVDTSKVPAVSKDNTVYTVTYTVEDTSTNGELTVSGPIYAIEGAEPGSEPPTSLTWENTYTPGSGTFDPDGDITPDIKKQILGYDAAAQSPEGYTFELSVKNTTSGAAQDSGFTLPTPATATSEANGDIDFGAITFTAEGTYEITIAEQIPGSDDPEYDPDMTYDSHKLVYTVSVEDDHAGSLVATVDKNSISEGETTFRNVLTPEDEKSVYSADDLGTEINGQLVGVGDKLTYTIDWVNNAQDSFGAPTSATVTVTDTIPEGTRLVEGTISQGGSLGQDGKIITWTFANQDAGEAGQVQYTVEVTEDAVKITNPENTVTNTAQIQVGENNPAQNTNTVENPVPEKTETTNASEVTEGTELTYQIAFKNTAGDNGTAAVVDELTKGQEYVAGSTSITVNGGEASATEPTVEGTASDGQKLTWNLTGLAADAQVVLTFDVTITRDAGATVDNTATVNGHKTNVVTTPYPSESTKDVSYADEPEVSINGQMVGVGDELLYTIDWAAKADGVLTVTDTIPTGTTYVSGSADNNGSYDEQSHMITWNLGQHSAGDKGTVTFKVTVNADAVQNAGNAVTNRAQIQIGTDAPDISYTNDVTNYVPEKSVTDNDTSTDGTQVGDTLTYTIQYANAGDEPVDMVITDTLDEGLTYVAGSAGANAEYDADTRTITWRLKDVPDNTMDGQVSFQAVVNENAAGQTIENEAKITVGHDPQITTNKTETEVKSGSLTISKTITVNTDQGTKIDTEKEFIFTVVLTDKKGNTLDGGYSYRGTSDGTTEYQGTIKSGDTITLKHNGSVTITGLPEGAQYTVTEKPEDGYTAQNAEIKGTIPADSAATAAFVNNYSAGQATLTGATNLEVTKVFNGKNWGDEVFTFTLTQTDGDKTKVTLPANASDLQIGKDTTDHKAAFGDIIFTAAGEYTFEISEVIPENPGQIQYDNHAVTIKVNVTDNNSGNLVASVASATTSGSMTFKNTYTPQKITANIQALKTMSGRDLRDTDKFTFTITPQNGAPATTYSKAYNGGQNNAVIDFGNATFTEDGTYTYLITETGGSVAGVTNSTQTITATVQVDYNEATGTLSSEVSYSGGDGEAHNTFTNVYKAAPVVPAKFETGITGTKTVTASEGNSYTMQGGEFSFTLTPAASNPSTDPVKETTITNGADGSLVFVSVPVKYTESGTYTYTVRENDSSEGGITEDGSLYTIVVEVTDSGDGQLAADVSISKGGNATNAIIFDNSYDPAKTGVTISGTKELTGKDIENNMFTFRITGDNGAPMPSATEVQNTGSSFAFGTIEYTEPGTYVYHISEVDDGKTGYTYDGTVYDVTVVVTDTDGALHTDVSGADAIVFKNSYTPDPVTLTGGTALRAHKTLTGRGLNAEEFVFEVKDADGNVLTTGTNDADGNIVFKDLTFSEAGTYLYTVSEKDNNIGGIAYDDSIYTVQIDVRDAGGYLEAAVKYLAEQQEVQLPEFENTYTAQPTAVSLGASKILTGRTLRDGEFTFQLKDADGTVVARARNDASGAVKFDELSFSRPGTYTYTVAEVEGSDSTITYDKTVYTVVIQVADDLQGHLVASVADQSGAGLDMTFTNKYTEPAKDVPDSSGPDTRKGVRTGDTAPILPVVAVMAAALVVILITAAVIFRRRRR